MAGSIAQRPMPAPAVSVARYNVPPAGAIAIRPAPIVGPPTTGQLTTAGLFGVAAPVAGSTVNCQIRTLTVPGKSAA